MKKIIAVCAVVFFLGCAAKKTSVDMSDYVMKEELSDTIHSVYSIYGDCASIGEVTEMISDHRGECLHACDSK